MFLCSYTKRRHQTLKGSDLLALKCANGLRWLLVTTKNTGVVWSAVLLQLLLGDLQRPVDLWGTYLCKHITVLPDYLRATKITMSRKLCVTQYFYTQHEFLPIL
ncbi:MRG/MORF4L-binding protein [Platysternon megacephalum]|uniref:MRG/MORF4L-binding protein n=1 Tax=Platysternon megacephalum TaxID=55544 RepID=A0A4D9E736_9SAUR|nr:MRG/MORF4L-binding protein [Platysternon megacephalum]